MKIAVGLFGMHFSVEYDHWCFGKSTVDYRRVYTNNQEFLWSNTNISSLDFYGSTYDSPVIDQLTQDYKFKSMSIATMETELKSSIYRNQQFRSVLNLIKDVYSDYDWIVITRYDLRFISSPWNTNISSDHVNLLYRAKWGDDSSICDDNFYLIPRAKFQEFFNFIAELPLDIHSHWYNHHYDDFHYMVDGCYYSHESTVYHIDRFFIQR